MNWINLPDDLSLIPVTDLREERNSRTNKSVVNFTVCVSTLFGSLYDWQDVLKFIEVNRVLGKYNEPYEYFKLINFYFKHVHTKVRIPSI